jgi:hypothetical protein
LREAPFQRRFAPGGYALDSRFRGNDGFFFCLSPYFSVANVFCFSSRPPCPPWLKKFSPVVALFVLFAPFGDVLA